MTHLIRATAAGGALLAAAALLVTAPAQAAPGDTRDGDYLNLTVTKEGDGRAGGTRGTLLLCDPPQGHSRAAEACAELAAVGGDITRITPTKGAICSMIYAPVTAQARGEWNGRPIEYRETFSNSCVMAARTGPVFALDG
ncbi:subtilisin inhibitor-like [Streptomyces sp. Ag109_O5-1]|uniref:SSI family serine proteinase inhibitor n=1 Tax=Streptomyces sp. Ag109_O5-1 TaxID=1938851 RepID=UPI000F4E2A68|nr:SSI family serine proteinase inhibitor [Streptomyces sp. Ag109_O5-1]RPE39526.1 subtilisin inhibitor-like [Streptomyces sp. Ag109_O5-1]